MPIIVTVFGQEVVYTQAVLDRTARRLPVTARFEETVPPGVLVRPARSITWAEDFINDIAAALDIPAELQ